jgi:ankyrin repeat protein
VAKETTFNFPIIELLVKQGANTYLTDNFGRTPLDYARRAGIEPLLLGKEFA